MKIRIHACIAIPLLLLSACRTRSRQEPLHQLSPSQIADRATPATIEVISKFEASGAVDELEPDVNKLVSTVREQSTSTITRETAIQDMVELLYADPLSYLRTGDRRHLSKSIYALGTGFIVTPDGYILTNAHVVEPEEEELKKAVVTSVAELVGEDADSIEKSVEKSLPGRTISAEASERLKTVLAEQYARRAEFSFNREVHVLLPTAHGDTQVHELRAEVKSVGQPTPGKDVAVLKIDGSDLPTLPLASSIAAGGIRTGVDLYVLGYPGSVALFPDFTASSSVAPSLTSGHVSGLKDMSGGWQVIQTDAAVNPGNSGGPVLNDFGQVVGLATFKLKDSEGVNFAVSIDLAQQFLNNLNVTPRTSDFTREFDAALTQYDRPGHGRALHMFKELSDTHPGLSSPREFVRELGGNTTDPPPSPHAETHSLPVSPHRGPPVAVFLLVVLVVVGGLIALIAATRR